MITESHSYIGFYFFIHSAYINIISETPAWFIEIIAKIILLKCQKKTLNIKMM